MSVVALKQKPTAQDLSPESKPYEPRGACSYIFKIKDSECLISGPAGTGKSVSCLSKLFLMAEKYPGMRGLILRKTRESITQSALVSFEEKVVPEGHPILRGPQRSERKEYAFPNGSKIIVGGLRQSSRDNSQAIMSTEYDIAYVQEAIELTEEEWEKITTRLRNNKVPYQQLIADTNPSSPSHWLKKRCDKGKTLLLESRHTDNPLLWDKDNKNWTEFGRKYIAKLDALTGARKQRLRFGRWVQAEGVVWQNWDASIHVIRRFEIPKDWTRYRVFDFGYTHPFVCLWFAVDNDGRMYLYREYAWTKDIVEHHAKKVLEYSCGEKYDANICDHDAEDRATLQLHLGEATVSARKELTPGLQLVESRLKVQGDNKPRLYVFEDCLIDRDPEMEESKRPIGFIEEVDSYIWNVKNPENPKEEPVKNNDDSCDCVRYMAMHLEHGIWVHPDPIIVEEVDPVKDWRENKKDWRSKGSINWRLSEDV